MLTQHSLHGPRQTREPQLQNEVTQLSAQGGRKKLEINTVSLLLRASHPALALRHLSLIFTCTRLRSSTRCKSGAKQGQGRSPRSGCLCRKAASSPGGGGGKLSGNREMSCLPSEKLALNNFPGVMGSQLPTHQNVDAFHTQTRQGTRLGLVTSATSQRSQLDGAVMVTKGFLQAPAEIRAGQGAGEKASGPGWGNMERRGWQPLGKTTTKEERMCLWRKGDKGDPGAVQQRT